MYNYCITHLYTNESPNLESCFFWPAPACVSVLRLGFPGSCCVCDCLLSNCLVVPIRCLGFPLVLLSGSVAVVCVRCICSGSVRCTCTCCCGPVLSVSGHGHGPAPLCTALYPSCISSPVPVSVNTSCHLVSGSWSLVLLLYLVCRLLSAVYPGTVCCVSWCGLLYLYMYLHMYPAICSRSCIWPQSCTCSDVYSNIPVSLFNLFCSCFPLSGLLLSSVLVLSSGLFLSWFPVHPGPVSCLLCAYLCSPMYSIYILNTMGVR